jgi:hypothetical protein
VKHEQEQVFGSTTCNLASNTSDLDVTFTPGLFRYIQEHELLGLFIFINRSLYLVDTSSDLDLTFTPGVSLHD